MKTSFKQALIAAALGMGAYACGAAAPSRELVDARAAYARIRSGAAGTELPAEVHDAKKVLDRAEASHSVDDAYLAQRKAQRVEAHAAALLAERQRDQATKELQEIRLARGERAERDLVVARQRAQATEKELEQERQARLGAEKKAQEALDNLAKMAALKQEARGLVITLSGAVTFVTNEATLLPVAMSSLNNVAAALKATPDRSIVVEGHTDSVGSHAYNMDLSQRRAEAVRLYLISQGVPQEIIRAQGIGPDRPVADNRTAEGRASNRRVEIVVSPPEPK